MNTFACLILHPTSPDTLTLQNLHKFSNSFVFDNYNLLIQIVDVLCVGFLLFCREWEKFWSEFALLSFRAAHHLFDRSPD
jgi:hypothetical protein